MEILKVYFEFLGKIREIPISIFFGPIRIIDFRSPSWEAPFSLRFQLTNYVSNHGLLRLLRTGSQASPQVDFFPTSIASFKREVNGFASSFWPWYCTVKLMVPIQGHTSPSSGDRYCFCLCIIKIFIAHNNTVWP